MGGENAQHYEGETFPKKIGNHLLTLIQKSVAVQTSGSVFVERVEQARKTELEN